MKRKRNKRGYSYNPHKHGFGDFMNKVAGGAGLGSFGSDYAGLSEGLQAGLGQLASFAGDIGGKALSGGLESGAGNMVSGLSSIASSIPGPWGAIAGAGLGVAGGLVNRMFGMKEDKEAHDRINRNTNYLSTFNSNASNFDDIQGPQAVSLASNVYKGGWFSGGKAARKNQELRDNALEALAKAERDVENNVDTLNKTQMDTLQAGFYDYGGPLHSYGADWTNGINIIGNGGTHESNPYEGVPMGIAPDGEPNLVEEGEVIFNDYVFSNRIKVPKAVRNKYKLRGQKDMTFADAAKKAQKESEERPNDSISKRGLEDIMGKLMMEQENIREMRQQREYSEGGDIHIAPSKRGTFTAAASKHGMGVQEFASKVLSNPEDYSPAMRKKANFARNANKWKHALGGHIFDGISERQKYHPNALSYPSSSLGLNFGDTPTLNIKPIEMDAATTQSINDAITKNRNNYPSSYTNTNISPWSGLRFAPAIGSAVNAFTDMMGWTNKPDYSNADRISEAASRYGTVNYTPLGDYMAYKPFDRMFYANQLGAQAGATRRGLLNTSGGNRGAAMAGLLAADYNAQNQLGNLYRQADEYNLAQREKVANFNRGTNMANSEMGLKASIANRERDKAMIDAATKVGTMRESIDARIGAARNANLTNFLDNLGNIGRESATMNMINTLPSLYYGIGPNMGVLYKGARSKGGFITIKKKRRR